MSYSISYEEQIKSLEKLGYELNEGVTKKMILREVGQMTAEENSEEQIVQNPYSILYYILGWRNPEVPKYNFSEKCIWFDLDFFDPTELQYKWFMERMGAITNGEIEFSDISILVDEEKFEWIKFTANGIAKKWKLEKAGYVADHFVQRFSYLTTELETSRKYTYYDNGGQQWVIDYANDTEQEIFNTTTGLKREWLGDGNHFSEPPKQTENSENASNRLDPVQKEEINPKIKSEATQKKEPRKKWWAFWK